MKLRFEEVDRLIKLNRLDNALSRAPHARSDDDAKVVGDFLVDSWKTAAELGDEGVGLLSRRVTMIKLSKGDYILTQNKESQKFYIIVRGKVDVHRIEAVKNDGNQEMVLWQLLDRAGNLRKCCQEWNLM